MSYQSAPVYKSTAYLSSILSLMVRELAEYRSITNTNNGHVQSRDTTGTGLSTQNSMRAEPELKVARKCRKCENVFSSARFALMMMMMKSFVSSDAGLTY